MSADAHRYILVVDGREIELSEGEVTLGRSRSATVRVDHESVSRSHALLSFSNGTAVLKDLNSSNGTFVAGRRILNETILRSGDRLQVGAAVLEYRLLEPTGPVERTALLTPSAVEGLPDSNGPGTESPPAPPAPAAAELEVSSPLEISADDLFRGVDDAARGGSSPAVVASAALAAVHSSGVNERPPLDLPLVDEPPPSPAPAQSAAPAAPPRRPADATLSQFPIRSSRVPPSVERPAPAIRVRKPVPPAYREATGREAAGFFPRVLATLVDAIILLALNLLLLSPVFLVLLFREAFQSADLLRDWAFLGILAGCGVMILGANLWYVIGGWARTGRTPGKALLRLSVVATGPPVPAPGIGLKSAIARFLAWNLSGALLGVGYLLVLFRKDRRALHDLVAGTRVVRTP
ncbi:MAG: FHA domain-containing protein [Holophagales bacterium]|nr:FHA domain-containing protein [Holophagales bacterium]